MTVKITCILCREHTAGTPEENVEWCDRHRWYCKEMELE